MSSILPKNEQKQVDLRYHSTVGWILFLFFRRIQDTNKSLRNCLPIFQFNTNSIIASTLTPQICPKIACFQQWRVCCLSTRILRQFDAYDMSMKYLNDDSYEANFHLAFGHITGYNLTPGIIKTDFPKYICYTSNESKLTHFWSSHSIFYWAQKCLYSKHQKHHSNKLSNSLYKNDP